MARKKFLNDDDIRKQIQERIDNGETQISICLETGIPQPTFSDFMLRKSKLTLELAAKLKPPYVNVWVEKK